MEQSNPKKITKKEAEILISSHDFVADSDLTIQISLPIYKSADGRILVVHKKDGTIWESLDQIMNPDTSKTDQIYTFNGWVNSENQISFCQKISLKVFSDKIKTEIYYDDKNSLKIIDQFLKR
ncbi:hypothetical protein [Chitinophaga sp. sic0106]|uniref:hypothetical protein n=1 Tax=Chitinophaga sp. sic0106 TaxID=2854785 RepID=UPI001C487C1F|nr:hypothetical protein [Chitinophaga sp. sic0106]MBV7530990.1 hypothetical protein [Chitinophaga sp. sic0106]